MTTSTWIATLASNARELRFFLDVVRVIADEHYWYFVRVTGGVIRINKLDLLQLEGAIDDRQDDDTGSRLDPWIPW